MSVHCAGWYAVVMWEVGVEQVWGGCVLRQGTLKKQQFQSSDARHHTEQQKEKYRNTWQGTSHGCRFRSAGAAPHRDAEVAVAEEAARQHPVGQHCHAVADAEVGHAVLGTRVQQRVLQLVGRQPHARVRKLLTALDVEVGYTE
eukprot:285659-Chlamydomonas_euryale.AAC.1